MEYDRIDRLTEQQRVCLRMVYSHLTSKEIAPRLGIEPNSVDQHIKAAMRTLGVPDRRTAALILAQHESRPAALEMRESQATFKAFAAGETPGTLSGSKSARWVRRLIVAIIAILVVALAIGILMAALEMWLRVLGFSPDVVRLIENDEKR